MQALGHIYLYELCGVSSDTSDTSVDEGELNSDGVIWATMGGGPLDIFFVNSDTVSENSTGADQL